MEKDLVFQSRLDLGARFHLHAVEHSIDISQRLYAHFQSERDLERTFPRAGALQFHLIGVLVYPHENLRQRNIFLGVEIIFQLLITEHSIANENALGRINPAKPAPR